MQHQSDWNWLAELITNLENGTEQERLGRAADENEQVEIDAQEEQQEWEKKETKVERKFDWLGARI